MSITAMKQALEALEKLSSARLVDGTYADKDCNITFSITALRTAIAEAEKQEPFGSVTVRRLSRRHIDHVDQYEFYPVGQPPYLDNADECHAVYLVPQQAPKQEPEDKCWCDATGIGEPGVSCGDCPTRDYAAPAQAQHYSGSSTAHVDPFMQAQERKPLTDEQITEVWRELRAQKEDWSDLDFARAIEAKIKEINHV